MTKGFQGDLKVNNEDISSDTVEDVEVSARMTIDNKAGNYTGEIEFNNGTAVTKSFDVELLPVRNISVSPENISFEAKTGSTGIVEGININNTGNVQLDTTFDIKSDSGRDIQKVIDINRRILIQPQTSRKIISTYATSESQEPGSYNGTVVIENKDSNLTRNITREIPITAEVVDEENPSVNITAEKTNSTLISEIKANADDNVGIDEVKAEVMREVTEEVQEENQTETVTENKSISNFTLTPSGDGEYEYDFEDTKKTGKYYVVVNATDTSGNYDTDKASFEVEKLDLFDIDSKNINADASQTGTWSTAEAFTMKYERDAEITLKEFTYGIGNSSISEANIQIILPNGGKDFFSNEGESITISQAGDYKIRVKGNKTEVYNARFSFSEDDWYHSPENLVITGNFRDVPTPDSISRDWAGADWMKCSTSSKIDILENSYEYSQTNNLDEARYVCVIPFKLQDLSGDIENNAVPVPPGVYDQMKNQQQTRVNNLEDEVSSLSLKNWIKNALLIITWIGVPIFIIIRQRASMKFI